MNIKEDTQLYSQLHKQVNIRLYLQIMFNLDINNELEYHLWRLFTQNAWIELEDDFRNEVNRCITKIYNYENEV